MRKAGDHAIFPPPSDFSFVPARNPPLPSLICPRGFERKQRKDYMLFAVNWSHRKFRGLPTSRSERTRDAARDAAELHIDLSKHRAEL